MIGLWPYLKAESAKLVNCFEMKGDAVLCEPIDRPTHQIGEKRQTPKNRVTNTTHAEAKRPRKSDIHKRE
jgi:hypothetical protein